MIEGAIFQYERDFLSPGQASRHQRAGEHLIIGMVLALKLGLSSAVPASI